jgi:hypothetical protein
LIPYSSYFGRGVDGTLDRVTEMVGRLSSRVLCREDEGMNVLVVQCQSLGDRVRSTHKSDRHGPQNDYSRQ